MARPPGHSPERADASRTRRQNPALKRAGFHWMHNGIARSKTGPLLSGIYISLLGRWIQLPNLPRTQLEPLGPECERIITQTAPLRISETRRNRDSSRAFDQAPE